MNGLESKLHTSLLATVEFISVAIREMQVFCFSFYPGWAFRSSRHAVMQSLSHSIHLLKSLKTMQRFQVFFGLNMIAHRTPTLNQYFGCVF